MKNIVPFFLVFLLIIACSKSDSNGTETESQLSAPTISTTAISGLTQTSAISGGTISDDGGAAITAKGLTWSTATAPSISDTKTSSGAGAGAYESSMQNLEQNTRYYVRAYATNSVGTAYGNEISFTTLEPEAKVFQGDVVLTSQQEVDEFGAEGYAEITGSLSVKDANNASSIMTIAPLNTIITIGGGLILEGNQALVDLKGFSELMSISGQLRVVNNTSLESFEGLEQINVLDNLYVFSNESLTSFVGLNGLTQINKGLSILSNNGLIHLNGLENLIKINNGKLSIRNNMSLIDLLGLNNLKSLGEGLEIEENDALEDLTGLESLEETGIGTDCLLCLGTISIEGNDNLLNIDALENLTTAWNAYLRIKNNDKLVNLNGFKNLVNIYKSPQDTGIFGASVESNNSLNDVCGLKNVYDNNPGRFYVDGLFNGTENPEGSASDLLFNCE